ncbi:MAG TPA: hypothetical protein VGC52_03045 [Gemmatimonadaceae bacterium]
MVDLVLGQSIADAGAIGEYARFIELGTDSHFLEEPPPGCNDGFLTGPGMTAACIGPQPAAVILVISSPLQENSAIAVPYKNREGAMKATILVSVELRRRTNRLISLVHKNY